MKRRYDINLQFFSMTLCNIKTFRFHCTCAKHSCNIPTIFLLANNKDLQFFKLKSLTISKMRVNILEIRRVSFDVQKYYLNGLKRNFYLSSKSLHLGLPF